MKERLIKCKICKNKMKLYNSLRPYCSYECGAKYAIILQENNKAKELNEKVKSWKPNTHAKDYKKSLQDEINKLARMIDEHFEFTCIDCDKFLDKEKNQIDACHLHSRKKNGTLKYNLHNLHSGHNHCNKYNENHESKYKIGLEKRYGNEYLKMVEYLPIKYKEIHLSNVEVIEKLAIVRKLIRDFKTFTLHNGMTARYLFNKIIGVYN